MHRPATFKPIFTLSLPIKAKVPELIDSNHQWKEDLINSSFAREDTKCIKGIPLPRTPQEDMLLWHFDKKRSYTVKSGYQIILSLKFSEPPIASINGPHGWQKIWKLKLPEKIKFFVWRARIFY